MGNGDKRLGTEEWVLRIWDWELETGDWEMEKGKWETGSGKWRRGIRGTGNGKYTPGNGNGKFKKGTWWCMVSTVSTLTQKFFQPYCFFFFLY